MDITKLDEWHRVVFKYFSRIISGIMNDIYNTITIILPSQSIRVFLFNFYLLLALSSSSYNQQIRI